MSLRRPLLLAFGAFLAVAALVVLQTGIFQLLPYDSSSFGIASSGLRAAFLAADVTLLVALVVLVRRAPAHRGLFVLGALLTASGVIGDGAALGARVLGDDASALRSFGATLAASGPMLSLGTTLVFVFALAALRTRATAAAADGASARGASARGAALLAFAVASIAISVVFKLFRAIDGAPRSLPLAWLSWVNEVARPAAIAYVTLATARSTALSTSKSAATAGPYRAAAEGAATPASAVVLDAATEERVRFAARGLGWYRNAFLVRIVATVLIFPFLAVGAADQPASTAAIVVGVAIMTSLATATLMVLALRRVLSLPRASNARGRIMATLVTTALIVSADALTLAYGAWLQTTSDFGVRRFTDVAFAEWAFTIALLGASMLALAAALRRLGETVEDAPLVRAAGWSQGMLAGAGAFALAFLFGSTAVTHSYEGRWGGIVAALAMLGAACVCAMAALVLHVKVAGAGRRALLRYADDKAANDEASTG